VPRTSRLVGCLLIVLAFLSAGFGRAEDWPTYQHDNRRSGVTSEVLRPPLARQWVYESPCPPAQGWDPPVNGYFVLKNASPVSDDDSYRVTAAGDAAYFAASGENRVYAVEAASGKVKWTFFTDAPPRYAPTVWKDKVYFAADDGVAYCLRAADGTVVWKVVAAPTNERTLGQGRLISVWPIRTGVMVDGGAAYFAAGLFPAEGVYLFAVDAETGKTLWTQSIDRGGRGGPSPEGHLLASADSLWVTSRVAPSRFALKDGSPIEFSTPLPSATYDAYRWYNGGSYAQVWSNRITYGSGAILCFDPDKEVLDRYKRPHKGDRAFDWFLGRRILFKDDPSAALRTGLAYIATDYHLLAVPHARLPEMAEAEGKAFRDLYVTHRVADHLENLRALVAAAPNGPEAALCKQRVQWGAKNYEAFQARSKDIWAAQAGKCTWMVPLQATEALVLAGDTLYAGGEDFVVAVDAATGKELWREATGSRVRGLAVAHGRLYVSSVDGKVACYAGPLRSESRLQAVLSLSKAAPAAPFPRDEFSDFYASLADELAKQAGAKGYALILGGGDGRLAFELARRTEWSITVLDADAGKVAQARKALADAGLYGRRVTAEQGDLAALPYPPYVFNVVVDQEGFFGGALPRAIHKNPRKGTRESYPPAGHSQKPAGGRSPEEILRVTRPAGGVAYLGQPAGAAALGTPLDASALSAVRKLESQGATVEVRGAWAKVTRGKLPGSSDWTYQFGTPANTYCSEDQLVKGPFGVLWFGSPGPRKTTDRHAAGPPPLVVNGVMYLAGRDLLMAYDAYNGTCLWERKFLNSTRGGQPIQSSNLAADSDRLFFVVQDRLCHLLEPATGRTLKSFSPPARGGEPEPRWGWLAATGGLLYGSRAEPSRRGVGAVREPPLHTSDAVFAIDPVSEAVQWTYEGKGIEASGIAIGDGTLFLLDKAVTEPQRQQGIAGAVQDPSVPDRQQALDRQGKPIKRDVRLLVALDAATGAMKWTKPLDVTDFVIDDRVLDKGIVVACMYRDKTLVVASCPALWHTDSGIDLRDLFAKGRRSIYAFESATGKFLWGGRKYSWKRPVIIGQTVLAEPRAYDLKTGKPKTITNPFTGAEEAWTIHRGYSGCGGLLASGACIFGNGLGGFSHYNLRDDCGFTPFANMSHACNLNSVPAAGLFVSPEGRSGCACDTPLHASIVLYPRSERRAWSTYVADPIAVTPVKHLAVNLGAPGTRRDARNRLWLDYPLTTPSKSLDKWAQSCRGVGQQSYYLREDRLKIAGTDTPWVFTSGCYGNQDLSFRLLEGETGRYTVRLYFAEPEDLEVGQRVFSLSLQGQEVLKDLDIVRAAGHPRTAWVSEFRGVAVSGDLKIRLAGTSGKPPLLCGFEAVREDAP